MSIDDLSYWAGCLHVSAKHGRRGSFPARQDSSYYAAVAVATQGRASHLAAFPDVADVSACTKFHVLAAEGSDLAITEARLNGHQQERSVSPPDPGSRIWCCHQGIAFVFGHEFHRATLIALRRNRQDALAMQCQCGFADGYVLEERVQSCQAVVPCPGTVTASEFEVFEAPPLDFEGPLKSHLM